MSFSSAISRVSICGFVERTVTFRTVSVVVVGADANQVFSFLLSLVIVGENDCDFCRAEKRRKWVTAAGLLPNEKKRLFIRLCGR